MFFMQPKVGIEKSSDGFKFKVGLVETTLKNGTNEITFKTLE